MMENYRVALYEKLEVLTGKNKQGSNFKNPPTIFFYIQYNIYVYVYMDFANANALKSFI